ncbi:MAG: aminodeoxychorismate synthase, component I [Blastopirellula sp.]|nr:MAG: aminodeoxychorismate synthase, component I [Blastopirellula sp.]
MNESEKFEPVVIPLKQSIDALTVFQRLNQLPHCLFLDSSAQDNRLGRYSFVTADPVDFITAQVGDAGVFDDLEFRLTKYRAETIPGLPPFQGGLAGLWAYDFGREFEQIPVTKYREFSIPDLALGVYDVVVAFDHQENRAWIISQGYPETNPCGRVDVAEARAEFFLKVIEGRTVSSSLQKVCVEVPQLRREDLAPSFATPYSDLLLSNFSHADYLDAVQKCIDYIYAGDIFQVNLSQRLLYPAIDDAIALYERLRTRNPAPFSGFFDLGSHQIVSASPERFIQVKDSQVETRPIKGTRSRIGKTELDLYVGEALQHSEKDRAENVMIVDLMRNDLSRICLPESVQVTELCRLETYATVQHLVSTVVGQLRDSATPIDLIKATFPGGSITGAPKIRAMEIIAEMEPTARGAYCGALGYIGFDGTMDSSILIRTVTAGQGWWQFPVGGGIVAQSDPQLEYEETWHKAAGILNSLK